ncbi:hypothetical protein R1flu_027509 [Riccia fluitans]|uniref:Uncharacterized protein n=1 Tax=Riccia fluitans TaxID=41844 RepID=A0ABD1XM02_9MARC
MPVRNILIRALDEVEAAAHRIDPKLFVSWKKNRDLILSWLDPEARCQACPPHTSYIPLASENIERQPTSLTLGSRNEHFHGRHCQEDEPTNAADRFGEDKPISSGLSIDQEFDNLETRE